MAVFESKGVFHTSAAGKQLTFVRREPTLTHHLKHCQPGPIAGYEDHGVHKEQ